METLADDGSTILLGISRGMADIRRQIARVARTTLPVVVEGETGTGKELVAKALHAASRRRGPYVPVNVSAIPETMFEAEMFGFRRGAFTGAMHGSDGLIRRAHEGTLLLDEIGSLALQSQPKLLRVLETGRVSSLGASGDVSVNVRYVAACNSELSLRVTAGRFREDLWQRLAGFRIFLPPLRDRLEDLPILVKRFLAEVEQTGDYPHGSITSCGLRALTRHSWPGNVRELKHVLTRALVLSPSGVVDEPTVREALTSSRTCRAEAWACSHDPEEQALLQALERTAWDIPQTAQLLNVTSKTVYQRIRRFGLEIPGKWRRRSVRGTGPQVIQVDDKGAA
jgi:DNA-binding NtrC family response regulator